MVASSLPKRMTWVAQGRARFESDWMALHRFLWMNALDAQGLWSVLQGKLRKARRVPDPRVKVQTPQGLDTAPAAGDEFISHFVARSSRECLGATVADHLLTSNAPIRFCPECLRECFHSVLFQLLCVQRCPHHDCDLQEACPSCGDALGHVRIELIDFVHPLACQSCGAAFSRKRPASVVFGPQAAGVPEFSAADEWMQRLSSVHYRGSTELTGNLWMSFDFAAYCECLVKLAPPPDALPAKSLTGSETMRAGAQSQLRGDDAENETYGVRSDIPLNDDLDDASTNAKAIGRYLAARLRDVCGHRRPPWMPWQQVQRPFERSEPLLLVAPDDCPCCAVLAWWRAYAGKLIALRELADSAGAVYDTEHCSVRYRLRLEPTDNAHSLLTSFAWIAHGLHRCLSELQAQGAPQSYWSRLSSASGVVAHDMHSIELICHRFEIDSFIYRFESEGKPAGFAYSLESAIRVLRACHQMRKQGLLWKSAVRQRSRLSESKLDIWYLGMSKYLNTRRGARDWQYRPPSKPCLPSSQLELFDEPVENDAANGRFMQTHSTLLRQELDRALGLERYV